jgi:hypothetical protein
MDNRSSATEKFSSVQLAFSRQADHYDADDSTNPILVEWRQQVYRHANQFLKPKSSILELNAGTGIDALYFVTAGHHVHATDIAPGMIKKILEKIERDRLDDSLKATQISFEALNSIQDEKFDYIFSNFGGLNCSSDLSLVTKHLPQLLKNKAYITLVIMPPICPWELGWALRGKKAAFRRLKKNGALAQLEGESFQTFYYSLADLQKILGNQFSLLRSEGLGALCPPPSSTQFAASHPIIYSFLKNLDRAVRNHFPFNRWADHIIVTFQYSA